MMQRHDPGTLWMVPDHQTAPDADQRRAAPGPRPGPSRGPAGTAPDLFAEVADLAVQVAEIARRLETVASSTREIRADVESVGAGLVAVCGAQQPTPAADEAAGDAAVGDAAVEATRIAMSWIQRSYHHPLRAQLVMLEAWKEQMREIVDRGYLRSTSAVEEVGAADECPTGRWLRSGKADALDRVRAAELRSAHLEHHRVAASVLAAVRDGRIDEARRLLEAEDGYAGAARRLGAVAGAWMDDLSQRRAQGAA